MSKKIAIVTSGIGVILISALVVGVISVINSLDFKLEEDLGDDWED